jgi:hypothetical protein
LGFKLVSNGEKFVRVALPYLATIYIVAIMLLRMGYSSAKSGGDGFELGARHTVLNPVKLAIE